MPESSAGPSHTLSEYESKQRLASLGVPVAVEKLAATADDAARAAEEIGGPVAVKLCGDKIAHKTERNLVRLGVAPGEATRAAAAELLAAARPEDGDVGVLVAQMVSGRRELIAGCVQDPTFGNCVMLGIGGIFAEALADVVFRLVPLSPADAASMIDDLHNQKMLDDFRGEPAVDREALTQVLLGLSRLVESDPQIVSVDLNPLIVSEGRPVAVDALIEVRGE
ncbi:MAG: acetate--CoA ligase family protein [Candidatus Binatia bacterium]|nr:acetate--CoA ligase family protein [Candidatus Binatia bacterium]